MVRRYERGPAWIKAKADDSRPSDFGRTTRDGQGRSCCSHLIPYNIDIYNRILVYEDNPPQSLSHYLSFDPTGSSIALTRSKCRKMKGTVLAAPRPKTNIQPRAGTVDFGSTPSNKGSIVIDRGVKKELSSSSPGPSFWASRNGCRGNRGESCDADICIIMSSSSGDDRTSRLNLVGDCERYN